MQDNIRCSSRIRLGIAPGLPSRQLAALLALQREEEPDVTLAFNEVSGDALAAGLREGRYDMGLALEPVRAASLSSQPVWRENLAVALSLHHPLLSKVTLTLDDVLDTPIFRWQAEHCPDLEQQLAETHDQVQSVSSFELLATWVSAGYGIGITAQSRIAHARAWGICMRPFTDAPYEILTYMLHPAEQADTVNERFIRRARQVAKMDMA